MTLKTHHEKLLLIEECLDEALDVMDTIPHDQVEKKFLTRMETFAACLDDVAEQLGTVLNDLGPYEEPVIAIGNTLNPVADIMTDELDPAKIVDAKFSVVQ